MSESRMAELDMLIANGLGDRPGSGPLRAPLTTTPHRAKSDAYAAKMRAGNTPTTRASQILRGWPQARRIIASIAVRHGLEPRQLQKNGKHGGQFRIVVQARAEAMVQIRTQLGYSSTVIGRIFGGFHHTAVIYLIRKETAAPVERATAQIQLDVLEQKAQELLRGIAELRQIVGGGG